MKKCSFDIESLLEIKNKDNQISNRSYNEDTEDGSSDDGHTSYRSPPISSYALYNQLKTLDMTPHNNKNDPTRKIAYHLYLSFSKLIVNYYKTFFCFCLFGFF